MEITNKHNLPESLVNAIKNDTYTGPKADSNVISVTTIIGSPKIHFLKCKYWSVITEDVIDSIWKLLGSAAHEVVSRAEGKQDLAEQRIEKEINGLKVSGAFDLYTKQQEILDYKFTSAYSIQYNPEGKSEWVKQMNLYKFLLESCGFPVKALKIVAILRDWAEKNVKPGGDYPEIPVAVIDIPVWSKEETEKYLLERTELFKKCAKMDIKDLPDCTPEETWAKFYIMKEGRVTPVKKCSTMEEAQANFPNDKKHTIIEERGRCAKYCLVNKYCSQYQKFIAKEAK